MMFRLAEATSAYEPIEEGEHVIVTDRYRLFLGQSDYPSQNFVQRLRMATGDVEATVEEVRTYAEERGRTAVTWEVSSQATPADLAKKLTQLGMSPGDPPMAAVMVLREAPRSSSAVVVRAVQSVDELREYLTISHEVFDRMDRLPAELERITEDYDFDDSRSGRYLAWIDDKPVASARATFTDDGVIMNGGGTRAWARGRGAYRALVLARWQDAVSRGTPLLITRSGPMSQPILERLGFASIGTIHFLVDRF
ncbi:MAG TPA: hypothetical protein VFB62_08240 [Polyangiaceae bacterium]|jgi:hypothetical protein|nr:hypothetical protein [Polyangiaceae bacterium]